MGIHLEQGSTKFGIKVGDKPAALAAVKALADRNEAMGGESGGVRHFSWVATEDFVQATTLEDALDAWGWEAVITEEAGDIDGLRHMGGKLGDEDALFSALAPFVVSGSYIEARESNSLVKIVDIASGGIVQDGFADCADSYARVVGPVNNPEHVYEAPYS